MARGDPVWMRVDVTWMEDPRAERLSASENWLYMVCRMCAVAERTNCLPPAYDLSYLCRKASVRRQTMLSLLQRSAKIDSDRPIIFKNENGQICLPNLGKQHEKLDWKGDRDGPLPSPHGADTGPALSSRARVTEQTEQTELPPTPQGGSASRHEIDNFREAWNKLPEPIPKILRMGKARQRSVKARLNDKWWKEHYAEAINLIPSRPFLMGDKGWVANVDWFLRPESAAKILEGQYVEAKPDDGENPAWMSKESTDENPVELEDIPEAPNA